MGEGHYISKIRRNRELIDKVSEQNRIKFIKNIEWATELSKRLDQLDYDERQKAIENIHNVLDSDYNEMFITNEQVPAFGGK